MPRQYMLISPDSNLPDDFELMTPGYKGHPSRVQTFAEFKIETKAEMEALAEKEKLKGFGNHPWSRAAAEAAGRFGKEVQEERLRLDKLEQERIGREVRKQLEEEGYDLNTRGGKGKGKAEGKGKGKVEEKGKGKGKGKGKEVDEGVVATPKRTTSRAKKAAATDGDVEMPMDGEASGSRGKPRTSSTKRKAAAAEPIEPEVTTPSKRSTRGSAKKAAAAPASAPDEVTTTPSKRSARGSAKKAAAPVIDDGGSSAPGTSEPEPAKKKPRKSAAAAPPAEDDDEDPSAPKAKEEKRKRQPAKAKTFPPADLAPSLHPPRRGTSPIFALGPLPQGVAPNGGIAQPRGQGKQRPMLLGAHVSIGGGVAGALYRAGKAGANGLGMFVKSQRQWKSNPFEEEGVTRFREAMKAREEGGLDYPAGSILVHGSYLINLGNPDPAKWALSYECFRDDIARCHQLGLKLYNWHPGSTVGACTREESYASIAKAINKVHEDVPEVICVIENMANAKSNIIGTTFLDLASIIALVTDKSRVRVCLDTCHLFAAGYDIRTPTTYARTMKEFAEVVGNGYLAGMHLNDSKAGLGGCKDLHENIGLGEIGLTAFRAIMRDPLIAGIPLVLETPAPSSPLEAGELAIWQREIQLLYEIQGMGDDEWEARKDEVAERWRAERDKLWGPREEKKRGAAKGKGKDKETGKGKGMGKGKDKGKKGKKEEDGEEDESGCESHSDE